MILSIISVSFAQDTDSSDDTPTVVASKGGYAEVPAAKRPKPIDQEKAAAAAEALDTKMKTGNIAATKAATIAQKALNAVANAHPFVLLASAIGAVAGAFAIFRKKTSEPMNR